MIVRFIGTGNAFNSDGRLSQALWFESGEHPPFLVDAGPTALLGLRRHELAPDAIDTLFVTHLHGDHIAGWPFLLLDLLFLARRRRPLRIVGPRGTRERLAVLLDACYPGVLAGRDAFPLVHTELAVAPRDGVEIENAPRFDVVPVRHTESSIGYRFHGPRAAVAVSGDTTWCEGIEALARDTDGLILECTHVAATAGDHLSLAELRRQRSRLAAPRVVLVHLDDSVADALAREPIPGVVAARDHAVIEFGHDCEAQA